MSDAISTTWREVDTRVVDGAPAHVVRLSRAYGTSVEDLWGVCTDPDRLPQWLLPVSGQLRLGGRYQLEGHAGGTITRCDPPWHLAASWEYGTSVSWIDLMLAARSPAETELVLEHISHVADDEKWTTFGPGAVGVGWDLMLRALAEHLTSGAALDPARVRAWTVGPEGREFITLSAQRWLAADIEAGADADQARAAAEQTTAFYTGTSAPPGS